MPAPYFEGAEISNLTLVPKFGYIGPKSINFLFLAKLRMCLFQVWHWFSSFGILGQKGINFLILTNFDCTIFRRWWFQIWYLFSEILSPNPQILEHFRPKNINLLLILTKFCLHTILEVLISNLIFALCGS